MKCANCQNEVADGIARCTYCGQEIKQNTVVSAANEVKPKKNKWSFLVILLVFFALSAYNSFTNVGVRKNEAGIELLDKGVNYQEAIDTFAAAYNKVDNDDDKITILKNWAYAYWTNNQLAEAKAKFIEASAFAKENTSDYYLINGEIALLNNNPQSAEENYLKAAAISPDGFQINTTLGIFYMGMNDINSDYADFDKALIYNLKAYNVNSESEMVKENLASNYFYMEEYQEALDLFKLTSLENKAYNNYMIGLCYLGLEDIDKAQLYIQKAREMGFTAETEVLEYLNLEI